MAFFGTLCVKGNGKGIVVATGDKTFMGQVALMAQETEKMETPIAVEIKDFVFKVSGIAGFLGVLFFILGMLKNPDPVKNLVFLIGIIVANVPEGLLATVTVCLTLTANRMGIKNVQVKNLESVETLGSTSVVCSDKTGTLTTSVMTVSNIYYDRKVVPCDMHNPFNATTEREIGSFYQKDNSYHPSLARLLRIGVLCNNAVESQSKDIHGNPKIQGDGTEVAIYKFCAGHLKKDNKNETTFLYRQSHPKLYEIPFDSANKWQISIHRKTKGVYPVHAEERKEDYRYRAVAVLKGAPERVLNMCSHVIYKGVVKEKTEEDTKTILADVYGLAKQGQRVLAFADMELCPKEFDLEREEPDLEVHDAPEDLSRAIEIDGIWIKFQGEYTAVELNERDRNGDILAVEDHTFASVYSFSAAALGVSAGQLRLNHGSKAEELDKDVTLREMGYAKGTVFHAGIGPYRFEGTSRETANYPFGREKDNGKGLIFVGLYSMIDPARAGVPEAVAKCQDAGIKVIMVTGDYPVTAHAIAKNVNIIGKHPNGEYHMTKQEVALRDFGSEDHIDKVDKNNESYQAALIPGKMLSEFERRGIKEPQVLEDFWNEILTKKSIVFARASPQQKLIIVEACQKRGGVVAVTGDGVNDSPALKKADIGIAMGITGTDVAKETADMILKDDNFASIVNGIEEGRLIFDNLKKSIAYTLSSNIPEIAPFLVYQVAGVPLPLPTVMILLVDLGTDLAPAISMAHEVAEADIMLKSPRDQNVDKLVTWNLVSFSYLQIGVLQALAGFYAFFVVLWNYGISPGDTVGMDDNNLFAFTPGKYEPQVDGYWLWCFDVPTINEENGGTSCVYGPDPSVFSCYYDDDTFDDNGGLGEAGACVAPSDVENTNARLVVQFSNYYSSSTSFRRNFLNIVAKILLLEAAPPQSSCGDITGVPIADAGDLFACGYQCFTSDDCAAFKFSSECSHYQSCDEEEADVVSGTFWRVSSEEGRMGNYSDQLNAWKNESTTERELFGIFTETLYTLFNKEGYLKQAKPYSKRTCFGISEQVGAAYTRAYRDDNIKCDEFTTTQEWAYWNSANGACSTLNNCYNVDKDDELSVTTTGPLAGGETGQTASGVNSIYPIDQNTRRRALAEGNTAYFISIIIVQWADLMICKTRTRSLFEQTMTNAFMNYALFFETVLGACLVYIPILNLMMGTAPLRFVWWTSAIPFSIMIYIYDEMRKGVIRNHRKNFETAHPDEEYLGCWLTHNTFW